MDKDKIRDKLLDLSNQLSRLRYLKQKYSKKEFLEKWEVYNLAERLFEIANQIIIDICAYIISFYPYKSLSSGECISNLIKEGIITEETGRKIILAVKMRNLIVHQYAKIDHLMLYNAIDKFIEDANTFKNEISAFLESLNN